MVDAQPFMRLAFYACCGAGLAYCSAAPGFQPLPPDTALLRLSMQIAGARVEPCRALTTADIERMPPNRRHVEKCPRERAEVQVRLFVDAVPLVDETLTPKGFARDGSATIYRRLVLPAGRHRVRAEVNEDARQSTFQHVREASVEMVPGSVLIVDFNGEAGGVLFR